MDPIAAGFWGAYFGTAALALAGAFVFMRSARSVAYSGMLAVLLSSTYALVFLGWVPLHGASLHRLQAVVAAASVAILVVLLLSLLGTFRTRQSVRRARLMAAGLAAFTSVSSSLFPVEEALEFSVLLALATASAAMIAAVASARRGERTGWLMLGALPCAIVGLFCLDWYAIQPATTNWVLHAVCALAGIFYLLFVAVAMWSRYAYLIEVRKVMSHGPNYDPVTWMPAFEPESAPQDNGGRAVGVIVVSISNLGMLEALHGRAAYNHALFACALRLRKLSFPGSELWRLGEDAFVFIFRRVSDVMVLADHSRHAWRRLSRPIYLGTSGSDPDHGGALWEPSAGVGVIIESGDTPLSVVVAGARATSRTAWSYPSRMAWFDESEGEIAELPA